MGDPADRPAWTDTARNPYLHGIHAPAVHAVRVAGERIGPS